MNTSLAKRLFLGLATCFFIISAILTSAVPGLKSKQNTKKKEIQDIRGQNINISINTRKADLRRMPRLMDIGPNTNTVIIPIVQFIMMLNEVFIFTSKEATGRLVHHCRTTFG